jgi:hypothetical protein
LGCDPKRPERSRDLPVVSDGASGSGELQTKSRERVKSFGGKPQSSPPLLIQTAPRPTRCCAGQTGNEFQRHPLVIPLRSSTSWDRALEARPGLSSS